MRADWRDPMEMKRTGWHRMWFNFGGINREVTLRKLAASEITTPTLRTRLLRDGSALVDITAHVRNRSAVQRPIAATGALSRDDERHTFDLGSKVVPAGGFGVLRGQFKVPKPKLWAPGAPNLYTLALDVPDETSYEVRTGLRELRKVGRRIYLNGKPIQLHGASLHEDAAGSGDAMTGAEMDQVINQLKAIGANTTRSQHPLNPAFMERLDAAGIMLYLGIGPSDAPGAWTSVTPEMRAAAKRRARKSFHQAAIHPSVIAWNLANEIAGNGHDETQARYIDDVARELKRRDPGRLVALDVWGAHPPKVAGPVYRNVDIVGDTNYIGWYEATHVSREERRALIRQHITEFADTFSGQGRRRHRVRRRGQLAQRLAQARRLPLPGQPAARPHQRLRLAAPDLRAPRLEHPRLRRLTGVRGRLDPPAGAGHRARARGQSEGAVHLRRPAEARRFRCAGARRPHSGGSVSCARSALSGYCATTLA